MATLLIVARQETGCHGQCASAALVIYNSCLRLSVATGGVPQSGGSRRATFAVSAPVSKKVTSVGFAAAGPTNLAENPAFPPTQSAKRLQSQQPLA